MNGALLEWGCSRRSSDGQEDPTLGFVPFTFDGFDCHAALFLYLVGLTVLFSAYPVGSALGEGGAGGGHQGLFPIFSSPVCSTDACVLFVLS